MNNHRKPLLADGERIVIREVPHLCVGTGNDVLLLLQYDKENRPIQYVVAHHPSFNDGVLERQQGEYFPLFAYQETPFPMCSALREAVLAMNDEAVYVAMSDEPLDGVRCVGVFTKRFAAESALEAVLNDNEDVQALLAKRSKTRFTFAEYTDLYYELDLDNEYWIDEHTINNFF